MQLNPELLRKVTLGLGLTAALAACEPAPVEAEPIDCNEKCTKEACAPDCKKAGAEYQPDFYPCPACGMG